MGTPVGKVRQISRLLIIFYKFRTFYFSRYFDQMVVRWIFFNSHGCFSFVFPFIYWGWRKKNVFCFHCVLEVKMGFLAVFPALSLDKAEWLRVGGDWKGNGLGFWCEGLYISSHYDSTENIQCAVFYIFCGVRAGMNPAPTLAPLTLNCGELSPLLNPFEVVSRGGVYPRPHPLVGNHSPPPCHMFEYSPRRFRGSRRFSNQILLCSAWMHYRSA